MAEIGRKGGEEVSQNTAHMAAIGRKGGEEVSQNTAHMAEIGRKGGEASHGGAVRRQQQHEEGEGESGEEAGQSTGDGLDPDSIEEEEDWKE